MADGTLGGPDRRIARYVGEEIGMKTHDTPSDIAAERGEVHIDGPGGVVVAMTPEAAAETSDRLLDAAVTAAGQRAGADKLCRD